MTALEKNIWFRNAGLAAGVLLAVLAPCFSFECEKKPGTKSSEETLVAGEKMYRTGCLRSGASIKAAAPGGAAVPGMTFACASCHTRSGLGSSEEGQRTLPINGERLFRPRYPNFPILTDTERTAMLPEKFLVPPIRPAYTAATLAAAIRKGIDPNGRALGSVMPRYEIGDPDLKILIDYLKRLSAEPSPGVTDTTIAFATVITDEVSQEDRDAMLKPLEWSILSHNNLGRNPGKMGVLLSMQEMRRSYRERTLTQWILKGPPDTWRGQLEEYYRKSPVFALVGGISTLPWEPIHRFCETRKIPCILPITELPVISATDFYTLYFSKGYFQEGEIVARHLEGALDSVHPATVVQVVGPGHEAGALAAGFQKTWGELGHGRVETMTATEHELRTSDLLSRPAGKDAGLIWLLWTGPESYGALKSHAGAANGPARVFMSASLLKGNLWDLPPKARAFTYLTYSFREPGPTTVVPKMSGRPVFVNKEFRKNDRRITSRTNSMIAIMIDRMVAMERNFYRDYFVELFETMGDQNFTDYENLIFSQGRIYGSESCCIMQLSEGPAPKLLRRDR
jgi:hypothetical protein